MDASIWANVLDLGNTLFRYLDVGQTFKFHAGDEVYVKQSRGWYRDARGNKFHTGMNTAVITNGE